MYKKILVPIDGSERSFKAALHAAELASRLGAEMTLFYVMLLPPSVISTEFVLSSITEESKRYGQRAFAEFTERLSNYNITMDTDMVQGNPADEICKKAKNEEYDLVVMGSRGLGEIKGYVMGSVSNRVSRHAACPVLIVR